MKGQLWESEDARRKRITYGDGEIGEMKNE